jgi:hypothetical protein
METQGKHVTPGCQSFPDGFRRVASDAWLFVWAVGLLQGPQSAPRLSNPQGLLGQVSSGFSHCTSNNQACMLTQACSFCLNKRVFPQTMPCSRRTQLRKHQRPHQTQQGSRCDPSWSSTTVRHPVAFGCLPQQLACSNVLFGIYPHVQG